VCSDDAQSRSGPPPPPPGATSRSNPDLSCNWAARVENENQASIITGLAIAAFSITWAAYSSARATAGVQLVTSPSTSPAPAPRETELREVRVGGGAASSSSSSAAAPEGTPASYAKEGGSGASGSASRALDSSSRTPAVEDDDDGSAANARPWLFHLVMALGGLYLAMLLTNWGTAVDASAPPTSYSEVSEPSMWVRIASQWAIYLVYAWTLFAPLVCKGRDFGS
jgi:serine incorporator 1/3